MAQHAETSSVENRNGITVHHQIKELSTILNLARGKQILALTFAGPTAVGKSSFISRLTGDRQISLGAGTQETTFGVKTYGPYSFSELKETWGLPHSPQDVAQVFFFDTQGFDGHTVGSQQEDRLIINELIGPYLAVSSVSVLVHESKIDRGIAESFSLFMETAQKIRSGVRDTEARSDLPIVDVVTNVCFYPKGEDEKGDCLRHPYNPQQTPGSFEEASEYVRGVTRTKIRGFSAQHCFALPFFKRSENIFEQSPVFDAGFRLAAQALLTVLETVQRSNYMDDVGFLTAFNLYKERCASENLVSLARTVRSQAEAEAVKRLLQTVTNTMFTRNYKSHVDDYFRLLHLRTKRRFAEKGVVFDSITATNGEYICGKLEEDDVVMPKFPNFMEFWKGDRGVNSSILSELAKQVPGFDLPLRLLQSTAKKYVQSLEEYYLKEQRVFQDKFGELQVAYLYWMCIHEVKSIKEELRRQKATPVTIQNASYQLLDKYASMGENIGMTERAKIRLDTLAYQGAKDVVDYESLNREYSQERLLRQWSAKKKKRCYLI